MKVVFHDRFREEYTADPAAARSRMESMVEALKGKHDFVTPEPATEEDWRGFTAERTSGTSGNPPVHQIR